MGTQRYITRRHAIRAGAGAFAAYLVRPAVMDILGGPATAVAAAVCSRLTPELTEGPYWVNTMLRRSDVRGNARGAERSRQAGVSLDLYIKVMDTSSGCKPLDGVAVDIWHANAHGVYSDESSQAAGGGTTSTAGDTSTDNWLRGYQITGVDRGLRPAPVAGEVSFRTIWPGWYTGRAIHIHVRVRRLSSTGATIAGYTTQIFFSDADNDHVLTSAAPYNTRTPQKDPTTDENDTVLTSADYGTNVVAVRGNIRRGYAATFNIALDNAEVGTRGSLGRPNAGAGGNGRPA
jgi:protocatechuate 3,4-dioxygenase beta subunit